jgi:hypothetical protein
MILQDDAPHLVQAGVAHPWSLHGYGIPTTPRDCARLITPPSAVMALKAGYRPRIHPSASAREGGGSNVSFTLIGEQPTSQP